jgi:tetraacyldisaccharide 4'-kinase
MIITTEKDAVRMVSHPMLPETIKPYIYVLPIEIVFLQDQQEMFNKYILDYVRKNSRNSRLFEE